MCTRAADEKAAALLLFYPVNGTISQIYFEKITTFVFDFESVRHEKLQPTKGRAVKGSN